MSKQITIDIEYALFGNQGNTIDVTKEVQDALMGDDITAMLQEMVMTEP